MFTFELVLLYPLFFLEHKNPAFAYILLPLILHLMPWQSAPFLASLLKRIDQLLQFDRLMPSYNGILTTSCIRTLVQIALKLSGSVDLDHVFGLIKPFRDSRSVWQVRIEASRALVDLEFHCRGINAALLLFIQYLEETSFRGQVKLGAHAMRLCQMQDGSNSNDDIKSTTLVSLLGLLEGHKGFNNVLLRHYLFCILQILAGRPATLFGVPREKVVRIVDVEPCGEPKNIFAPLVTEMKPLEPPDTLNCSQENFAIKELITASNHGHDVVDLCISEDHKVPHTVSNGVEQKVDLAFPEVSKEADAVSDVQERKMPVVKIRVRQSAASSRAEETDTQTVNRSQAGNHENDRGVSSSISVDAPQRNSAEAVSTSNQNLEEVNSCLAHGSRMTVSIGSVKLASDGDNFGKELQCTADSSKVIGLPHLNEPSSPSLMQDNVDDDALKYASLQTLTVGRIDHDGGSVPSVNPSGENMKEKKDKEKKRKHGNHKKHHDDPAYLERKRLKKDKIRKEKEMSKLLSDKAKTSSLEVLGGKEVSSINLTAVSLKANEPSGSLLVKTTESAHQKTITVETTGQKTTVETKPEPSEGSSAPRFRIKFKNRTLNK
uniref:Uncharacterized protein MANES_05G119100 n=1 Tax=Rhizophora mucronata TaxID=61149 RepID=A0A2P2MHN9_RHIMU